MKSAVFTVVIAAGIALLFIVPVQGKEIMSDEELEQFRAAGSGKIDIPVKFDSNLQPIIDPSLLGQLKANSGRSGLQFPLNPSTKTLVIRDREAGVTIRISLQSTESIQYFGTPDNFYRKVNIPAH